MENSQPNNQNNTTPNQQDQKTKKTRNRKTIEQELAELEARKQKLLESKRKAEAHEKIIFGAAVMAMLKDMMERKDQNGPTIARTINAFASHKNLKDQATIEKIIEQITGIKPPK